MNAYYSKNEFVELNGTLGELVDMRDEITEFAESGDQIWTQELDFDVESWHIGKQLTQIVFQKSSGKLRIYIIGSDLIISGDKKFFWPLSSYFHFDEFDTFPEKNRIDYYQNHGFLETKSLSLIIGIKNTTKLPNKAINSDA